MEGRFAKTALLRMAEFDMCKQKPGQSYRKYADLLTEKAYGLSIPREAMLRKFLGSMTHAAELRKFIVPQLDNY